MTKKVDIFKALNKMNHQDYWWFLNLDEEEVKSLSPYVLMLWSKGAKENRPYHIIFTNQFVNPFVFHFNDHPKLLYCLLCVANGGIDQTKYEFKKPQKAEKQQYVNTLIQEGYGSHEARDLVELIPEDELNWMADED